MEAGFFFLFPALAVESGEALEDFDAGGFGNRVADIVVRGKMPDIVESLANQRCVLELMRYGLAVIITIPQSNTKSAQH